MTNPDTDRSPTVYSTSQQVLDAVKELQAKQRRVALVPTMGALHEGHLSLIRAARRECDAVVATIFINPTQFGDAEDYQHYPRELEADIERLGSAGAEFAFVPETQAVYPEGFSTYVEPPQVATRWEGEHRPGHFRGVATIVLKLFHMIPADVAYFGAKDFQQTLVIRRMVTDLNLPIQIRVCATVREDDGLALSSRNQRLSSEAREQATAIFAALEYARDASERGNQDAASVRAEMLRLLEEAGITEVDYVALADSATLEPLTRIGEDTVALIAARVGGVRLIDNLMLT